MKKIKWKLVPPSKKWSWDEGEIRISFEEFLEKYLSMNVENILTAELDHILYIQEIDDGD